MSSSYRSFVKKFFPNAMIVADKFHVLRLLTPSIMKAGKEIHGHRQELSTRRKLLCSRKNLDYFVRVDIDRYLKNHDKLNEHLKAKDFFDAANQPKLTFKSTQVEAKGENALAGGVQYDYGWDQIEDAFAMWGYQGLTVLRMGDVAEGTGATRYAAFIAANR